MNSFKEIVERIKDEICHDIDGPVRYKHVADALGLKVSTVRIYVIKNHIPLQPVLEFCVRKRISVDWMLFGVTISKKELQWK